MVFQLYVHVIYKIDWPDEGIEIVILKCFFN